MNRQSNKQRKRATHKQLQVLVQFMIDNPPLAQGVDHRTSLGKEYHATKWIELANVMNAHENGMNKSPRDWNRYWKDLKAGIRKKVNLMKKAGRRKVTLNSIEEIIYKNMCTPRNKRVLDADEKLVEYLQDSSEDEAHSVNLGNAEQEMDFAVRQDDESDRNESDLEESQSIIESAFLDSSQQTENAEHSNAIKKENQTNKIVDSETNFIEDENALLRDIRDHLKSLLEVQAERAKCEQRLAAAYERRAILEERKLRIEERRLKMEERRLALEERKMEASEKSFATERRSYLDEKRIVNGT